MQSDLFYLYFPKDNEIMYTDNKAMIRRIFEGQVTFTSNEEKLLKELTDLADKDNKPIDQEFWTKAMQLRILYASKFRLDKALEAMSIYKQWVLTKLPLKESPEIVEYLQQGAIYMSGRDHRFRPIVVIDANKLEKRQKELDLAIDSLTFMFEFILREVMLPGQIENWVVIMDMGKLGVTALPKNALQRVLAYLQNNYRSRMFVCYIVNCPKSITIAWNMIKSTLSESTVNKIKFFNEMIPEPLFTHCHPTQVEERFGGTCPNIKEGEYWPPRVRSEEYFLKDDNKDDILITKEQYIEKYLKGELKKNKICPSILQELQDKENQTTTDLDEFEQEINLPQCTPKKVELSQLTERQNTPSQQSPMTSRVRMMYTPNSIRKREPSTVKECFQRSQPKRAILF